MNKQGLRILSKIGLLVIIFGFFMPIANNLNGFEIAKVIESIGETSLVSVSLYFLFIIASIGFLSIILLLKNIKYSISIDWIINILLIILFVILFVQLKDDDTVFEIKNIQSGVYIMLFGMLISFISLPSSSISDEKKKKVPKKKDNSDNKEEISTSSITEQSTPLTNEEQIILDLAVNKPFLTIEKVVNATSLDIDVAEKTLKNLVERRKAVILDIVKNNKIINNELYYFYTKDTNLLENELLSLIIEYGKWNVRHIYCLVFGKDPYESSLFMGKLYYLYINKQGTNEDWNKEEIKHKKLIDNIKNKKIKKPLRYGLGILISIISLIFYTLKIDKIYIGSEYMLTFFGIIIVIIFFIIGFIIGGLIYKKIIIRKDEEEIKKDMKKWMKYDYDSGWYR